MDKTKPNVVIIYADDLGYGDLSCYGAADISTPNLDKLAEGGIKFYDTYSTSAVCTPARYSLLTGEYPFRNKEAMILPGNAKCIIDKDKGTMPKMFKKAGYATGAVGKWHMGVGDGTIDWNGEIEHTPLDLGFDSQYIFPATNDRVPCVYLNGNRVDNLDPNDPIEVYYGKDCPYDDIVTYERNPELLKMTSSHGHNNSIVNGVGRIGYMRGGKSATWDDETMGEVFLSKAKEFADKNKEKPFFLYYALHQPHVPRIPSKRFRGKSKLGVRGDVIMELDWCVGQFIDHLKELGIYDDTIVIFSSDNGPVLDDGYNDCAEKLNGGHSAAGPLRGGKYSKFEGGARIPFILSWNNTVKPGVQDAILSQVDLYASFAAMLGVELDDVEAPDSLNMLDEFLGRSKKGRDYVLTQGGTTGSVLRHKQWTYLLPSEGRFLNRATNSELGNSKDELLYNLSYDIHQKKNVAEYYPEVVKEMREKVNEILSTTRTR